jgi:hypothetical protein
VSEAWALPQQSLRDGWGAEVAASRCNGAGVQVQVQVQVRVRVQVRMRVLALALDEAGACVAVGRTGSTELQGGDGMRSPLVEGAFWGGGCWGV